MSQEEHEYMNINSPPPPQFKPYTVKNATDLLKVVNFTCQFHQVRQAC